MVKIKRMQAPGGLSETNREFRAATAGMSTKEAYDFYKSHKGKYCYNTSETKDCFRKMNHERCSFCTRLIQDFDDEMTVEHIQIKRDYPQLIFQWSNLLCACRTCNTKRSTRAHCPQKYLDPTEIDDVEKYFCYQLDGKIVANGELDETERERADHMINLYRLNRKGLVCKRREFLREIMTDDDFYEKLAKLNEASQNIIFCPYLHIIGGVKKSMESKVFALDQTTIKKLLTIFKLIIPDFQRNFVWKKSKKEQLLSSLFRGFPIGAITLYKDKNGVSQKMG